MSNNAVRYISTRELNKIKQDEGKFAMSTFYAIKKVQIKCFLGWMYLYMNR
jgi:hypothetical protein